MRLQQVNQFVTMGIQENENAQNDKSENVAGSVLSIMCMDGT
jgi:hypothetical protein